MRYSLLLLSLICGTTFAAQRDYTTARQAAQLKLNEMLGRTSSSVREERQEQGIKAVAMPLNNGLKAASRDGVTTEANLPYYCFCDEQQQAFVFVAGSDLLPEVIGYGMLNGASTREADLPCNLRSWLESVAETEEWLELHPEAAEAQQQALARTADVTPIDPLMTCMWDQDYPFNEQCPTMGGQHCVTGCMATAISQVLYTLQFPVTPQGSVSYNSGGTPIKINFSNQTYDFGLMYDRYTRNTLTPAQIDEVAKLNYHVGAACLMQYGLAGSGAIAQTGIKGLIDNFGCTEASMLDRHNYSLDEWNDILINELEGGRPVVMMAQTANNEGHAFVLDGINDKGFYHTNWGWGGYYNGYFDVAILRAESSGIGASDNSSYCLQQQIYVNMGNPATAGRWRNQIHCEASYYYNEQINCSPSGNLQKGAQITLKANVLNNSSRSFTGYTGVVVYNEDGTVYDRVMSNSSFTINGTVIKTRSNGDYQYSSYGSGSISAKYTLPTDIADGQYKVYLCLQPAGSQEFDVVRQSHENNSYWDMTVQGNSITLKHEQRPLQVSVESWGSDSDPLTTAPNKVLCTVKNISQESLPIHYYLRMTSPDRKSTIEANASGDNDDAITLAPDEERELSFKVYPQQTGRWKVELLGHMQGIEIFSKSLISSSYIDVIADDTRGAMFQLLEAPIILTDTIYNKEQLTMELRLSNTGSQYNGRMAVRLFKSSTSTAESGVVAELTNEEVQLGANCNATVQISGTLNIENMTKNTKYYARAYFLYGEEMRMLETATGVTNRTTVAVRTARQEAGIAAVTIDNEPEDLTSALIYNVLGKRIQLPASGQLAPGIYIINGKKRIIK